MIELYEGDIFDHFYHFYKHASLAHGVNAKGRMDAGVAVEFKQRYPAMFREYQRQCLSGTLRPGQIFFWDKESGRPAVFNLVTQEGLSGAKESFLDSAVQHMYVRAKKEGIKDIAMPQIGSGLGGLSPDVLRNILHQYFDPSDIAITIYQTG